MDAVCIYIWSFRDFYGIYMDVLSISYGFYMDIYIYIIYVWIYVWATAKPPAILNMYWTDIGLWKLMEIVKNTR